MPETDEKQNTTSGIHEECPCRTAWRAISELLPDGPSERTKDHFRNSRVEFLKAVRNMLDERIDKMQRGAEKGTPVTVE